MLGKRFEFNDKVGRFLSDGLLTYMNSFHPTLDLFPISRFLPKLKKIIEEVKKISYEWKKYFDQQVKECLENSSNEDNFIQGFKKLSGKSFDPTEPYFIMKDFLLGGTNQTMWVIILLCNNPSIQKRLQKEVDSVVQKDRLPSLSDKIPYLEAIINEVMRVKTVAPLSLPHRTLCDTQVGGFSIPVDTQVRLHIFHSY